MVPVPVGRTGTLAGCGVAGWRVAGCGVAGWRVAGCGVAGGAHIGRNDRDGGVGVECPLLAIAELEREAATLCAQLVRVRVRMRVRVRGEG